MTNRRHLVVSRRSLLGMFATAAVVQAPMVARASPTGAAGGTDRITLRMRDQPDLPSFQADIVAPGIAVATSTVWADDGSALPQAQRDASWADRCRTTVTRHLASLRAAGWGDVLAEVPHLSLSSAKRVFITENGERSSVRIIIEPVGPTVMAFTRSPLPENMQTTGRDSVIGFPSDQVTLYRSESGTLCAIPDIAVFAHELIHALHGLAGAVPRGILTETRAELRTAVIHGDLHVRPRAPVGGTVSFSVDLEELHTHGSPRGLVVANAEFVKPGGGAERLGLDPTEHLDVSLNPFLWHSGMRAVQEGTRLAAAAHPDAALVAEADRAARARGRLYLARMTETSVANSLGYRVAGSYVPSLMVSESGRFCGGFAMRPRRPLSAAECAGPVPADALAEIEGFTLSRQQSQGGGEHHFTTC